MNCSEVQILTPLYLSSELEATRLADFELHLRHCGACARELESVGRCDELLRDAFREQTPDAESLRERVRNQIRKTTRRRFLFARPLYRLPIAAALLLAITAGIFFVMRDGFVKRGVPSQTVYAAARDDHYVEVVQRDPRPWLETPEEIREFVREELGDADFLERFKPAGYQLKRALHCYLLNQRYVHIVYEGGGREVSVFVRRKGAELPGAASEVVNGCPLHAASVEEFEVAGFRSGRYTVLIVSDLPRAESLQFVRAAAASFT
jgi:hypothetical protein